MNSPPESGGVGHQEMGRRGGSKGNHPPRDPLRDPAALLTKEGNFEI